MLEMQILSSQNEQRRLSPPESSRSGSEEILPLRDPVPKQRVCDASILSYLLLLPIIGTIMTLVLGIYTNKSLTHPNLHPSLNI